jgi:phage-related protein
LNLLDLYASLTLDDSAYTRGIAKAEATAGKAGDSIGKKLSDGAQRAASAAGNIGTTLTNGMKTATSAAGTLASGIRNVVGTVGSVTSSVVSGTVHAMETVGAAAANATKVVAGVATAGMAAASAATVALGKTAFDAYGEYEQLAGGVETLFGQNSAAAKAVRAYADNAFSTVQMSANEYMQAVTDFSASLLQTLDADAAADKADQALRQIADNANKMGTSMSSVEDAYKGFAKDNYVMLDNLKLGYGGTAGEMARLVNDAGVLNGEMVATAENVKDIPFATIIDAIGVIQERLGMAGVSQEEAMHTIQGSMNMLRAAWKNLLAGWANPDADLDGLVDKVMESLGAVQENALPAVERILDSMGRAVTKAAPQLASRLSELIQTTAPTLLRAAGALMSSVGGVVMDTLPVLFDQCVALLVDLIDGMDMGAAITSILDVIGHVAQTVTDNLPTILNAIIHGFADAAPQIRETVVSVVGGLLDAVSEVIRNGDLSGIVATITDTALDIIGLVAGHAPEFIGAAWDVLTTVIETALARIAEDPAAFARAVVDIVIAAFDGAVEFVGEVAPYVGAILDGLFSDGVDGMDIETLRGRFGAAIGGVFEGLGGIDVASIVDFCVNVVTTIGDNLAPVISAAIPGIAALVANIATELTSDENLEKIGNTASNYIGALSDGIQKACDEGSVTDIKDAAVKVVVSYATWLTDPDNIKKVTDAGYSLTSALSDGLAGNVEDITVAAGDVVGNIIGAMFSVENVGHLVAALVSFLGQVGAGLVNGISDLLWKGSGEMFASLSDLLGDYDTSARIRADLNDNPYRLDTSTINTPDDVYKNMVNMYGAATGHSLDEIRSGKYFEEHERSGESKTSGMTAQREAWEAIHHNPNLTESQRRRYEALMTGGFNCTINLDLDGDVVYQNTLRRQTEGANVFGN